MEAGNLGLLTSLEGLGGPASSPGKAPRGCCGSLEPHSQQVQGEHFSFSQFGGEGFCDQLVNPRGRRGRQGSQAERCARWLLAAYLLVVISATLRCLEQLPRSYLGSLRKGPCCLKAPPQKCCKNPMTEGRQGVTECRGCMFFHFS